MNERIDGIQVMIKEAAANCRGRKIAIWGNNPAGELIRVLMMYQYKTAASYCVDDPEHSYSEIPCHSPDMLDGKPDEYYVIVAAGYRPSITERLVKYGYKKGCDYTYFSDCAVEVRDGYYEDGHGNVITGNYSEADICFLGCGSTVSIGENVSLASSHIYAHSGSVTELGRDSIFLASCIYTYSNAVFRSGCSSVFNRLYAQLYDDSAVSIGDEFIVYSFPGKQFVIHSQPDTSVTVGNRCTFSYGISMMSQDGHSIFDVRTRENINSTREISSKRNIIIGDHVWIGYDVSVLYTTDIGSGSIIGASSTVKGRIPNNCIAVGSPAKVIRRDIAWGQINASDDINICGADNIALTADDSTRE